MGVGVLWGLARQVKLASLAQWQSKLASLAQWQSMR